MKYETALELSLLNQRSDSKINLEYEMLEEVAGYDYKKVTEQHIELATAEGEKHTVDADFIKTVYSELHPTLPEAPFGMLIASDGYDMKRATDHLWHTVYTLNVSRILCLVETVGM